MARQIGPAKLRHLEDADWFALIRHRSPGDVFRFLHGLHLRAKRNKNNGGRRCCVVCAPDDFENVWPLLGKSIKKEHHNPRWSLAEIEGDDFSNVDWLILNGLAPYTHGFERPISSFLSAWKTAFGTTFSFSHDHSNIFTTYSDARHFNQGYMQEKITFKRIDTKESCKAFPNSTACFGKKPSVKFSMQRSSRIAVVLRCTKEWRSTPEFWVKKPFYDRLLTALHSESSFHFFGLSESINAPWPKWLQIEQCYPYSGKTLPQQVDEARRYHLAIGVNSSALDVFSIAGVPVLRDCEFQAQAIKGWPFKDRYNSFLAGNVNVGLGIHMNAYPRKGEAKVDWRDRARFIRAFEVMANKLEDLNDVEIKWGETPRHAHVLHGALKPQIKSQIDEAAN